MVVGVRVCNICGKRGKTVKGFRLDFEDGFLDVTLCRDHSAPLWALREAMPAHRFVHVDSDHNRSRATSFRVTTLDEIEAAKKHKPRH